VKLDQILPVLDPHDATSAHSLRIDEALRDASFETEIVVEQVHPSLADRATLLADWRPRPDSIRLYQMAIGSRIADRLMAEPQPIILDYHNFTPARFFEVWEPHLVGAVNWGRTQLAAMAPRSILGLADSGFNAAELADAGCAHTAVSPILLDLDETPEPDPKTVEQLRNQTTGTRWLFVGRLAPNKAQHDIIKALAIHRRHINPDTHLTLIGNTSSPHYETALKRLTHHLDCDNHVTFTKGIDNQTLAAHYQAADLFICLSDHEGFCVPLLEAMHHQTPIIAYNSTAIPETLGNAGLLLTDKRPLTVATTAHHLHTNPHLKQQLQTNAKQQLHKYDLNTTRQQLLNTLTPHLN